MIISVNCFCTGIRVQEVDEEDNQGRWLQVALCGMLTLKEVYVVLRKKYNQCEEHLINQHCIIGSDNSQRNVI